jgi:hypothetical protein
VHKREETQVEREFLLGYTPMRAQPTPQERLEAFHRIHMDFTKTIAIFVSSAFASSVVDTLMAVAPGLQTGIDAVLVHIYTCARNDGVCDERLNGLSLSLKRSQYRLSQAYCPW